MKMITRPNNYYTAFLQYITIVIRRTNALYPDIECKASIYLYLIPAIIFRSYPLSYGKD
jgi:hypothetical protein